MKGYFKKIKRAIIPIIFDAIISFKSQKNSNFFFIQVGSCDGIKHDPIHNYVIKYNWSGILIEPVEYLFKKLAKNYCDVKGLLFLNLAISDESGYKNFYYLKETKDHIHSAYCELGSFSKDTILKHKKIIPNIEEYIVSKKVKTITISELKRQYNIRQIDLLNIDTEEHDYRILRSINFKNIKPKIILFEHKHLSSKEYKEIKYLLKQNNYLFFRTGADTLALQHIPLLDKIQIAINVFKRLGQKKHHL